MSKQIALDWLSKLLTPVFTALIVGAGGYFVALPVMQKELSYLAEEIKEMKQIVKANTEDISKLRERTAVNEANIAAMKALPRDYNR